MITSLKVGTKVILRDIVYVVPGVRLTVTFFFEISGNGGAMRSTESHFSWLGNLSLNVNQTPNEHVCSPKGNSVTRRGSRLFSSMPY